MISWDAMRQAQTPKVPVQSFLTASNPIRSLPAGLTRSREDREGSEKIHGIRSSFAGFAASREKISRFWEISLAHFIFSLR
jgi:hypothetical protein